ncbi:hypothetical protein HPB49_005614 [Dermacentor silvarum]|uniref:Uncharacterized protein n=1 Tax=Dermacentor silvarum TaxID=543639 RepID=A0ACB8DVR0_DERSI|nr:hypothetical protein HPB49_005614 [Dermacentor silvarum]
MVGYRFSDLLSRNDYVSALLLVFAVIGIILSALIVAAGLVNLATRTLANHGCDGSCQHQRRQHNGNPNNIDVSVQPTDTTIAAGGPALVAPHYNVSLMHLDQPRQPAPSCPPQDVESGQNDARAPLVIPGQQDPVDHVDDAVGGWNVGAVQRRVVRLVQPPWETAGTYSTALALGSAGTSLIPLEA